MVNGEHHCTIRAMRIDVRTEHEVTGLDLAGQALVLFLWMGLKTSN